MSFCHSPTMLIGMIDTLKMNVRNEFGKMNALKYSMWWRFGPSKQSLPSYLMAFLKSYIERCPDHIMFVVVVKRLTTSPAALTHESTTYWLFIWSDCCFVPNARLYPLYDGIMKGGNQRPLMGSVLWVLSYKVSNLRISPSPLPVSIRFDEAYWKGDMKIWPIRFESCFIKLCVWIWPDVKCRLKFSCILIMRKCPCAFSGPIFAMTVETLSVYQSILNPFLLTLISILLIAIITSSILNPCKLQ